MGGVCDCGLIMGNVCDCGIVLGGVCDCGLVMGCVCDCRLIMGNVCDCGIVLGTILSQVAGTAMKFATLNSLRYCSITNIRITFLVTYENA